MAVDTRNKRASCIGIDLPFRVFPNPDGTLNVNDRQHMANKYAGTMGASTGSNVSIWRNLLGVGI